LHASVGCQSDFGTSANFQSVFLICWGS